MARLTLKSQGFTIVELIVVIVVLGILTAIVTVSYQGIQRNTREATLQGDLREAAQEIEAYKSKNSRYPRYLGAINNLQGASPANTTTLGYAFISSSATGAYCLHARSTIDTNQVYRIQNGSSTIQTGQCTQALTPTATPSAPLPSEYLGEQVQLDPLGQVILVGWKDPAENGGSAITRYRVRLSFGGACSNLPDHNYVFDALANGQTVNVSGQYYLENDAEYGGEIRFGGGGCAINSPEDLASVAVSAGNSLGYGDEKVFPAVNLFAR